METPNFGCVAAKSVPKRSPDTRNFPSIQRGMLGRVVVMWSCFMWLVVNGIMGVIATPVKVYESVNVGFFKCVFFSYFLSLTWTRHVGIGIDNSSCSIKKKSNIAWYSHCCRLMT